MRINFNIDKEVFPKIHAELTAMSTRGAKGRRLLLLAEMMLSMGGMKIITNPSITQADASSPSDQPAIPGQPEPPISPAFTSDFSAEALFEVFGVPPPPLKN